MKRIFAVAATIALLCPALAACSYDGAETGPETTYSAVVEFNSPEEVNVSVCAEVRLLPDGCDMLPFALYPLLFVSEESAPVLPSDLASAYPGGFDAGEVSSLSVTGDAQGFDTDGQTVCVYPDNSVLSTRTGKFHFEYTLSLPQNEMRYGYDDFAVRLADFLPRLYACDDGFTQHPYLPIGDPFAFDQSDYDVTVLYPEEYALAAPGELSDVPGGSRTILEDSRDLTLVLLRSAEVYRAEKNGFSVAAYAEDGDSAEFAAKTALDAMCVFATAFGAPSRASLTVVRLPFYGGGMEYCGIVYVSDSLSLSQTASCIVHETAHQWWYADVGSDQVLYPWLDESLAQISVILYFRRAGMDAFADALAATARDTAARYAGESSLDVSRSLYDYESQRDYYVTVYCKAAALADGVCDVLGEEVFCDALALFRKTCSGRSATPDDLFACFGENASFVRAAMLSGRFT